MTQEKMEELVAEYVVKYRESAPKMIAKYFSQTLDKALEEQKEKSLTELKEQSPFSDEDYFVVRNTQS